MVVVLVVVVAEVMMLYGVMIGDYVAFLILLDSIRFDLIRFDGYGDGLY